MKRQATVLTVRPRLLRVAAVVVAALAAVSGCQVMSPVQTQRSYDPGDGVPASVGAVEARNLVVVAPRKGGSGVLTGSVVNTGDRPARVSFATLAGAPTTPTAAAAGASVELRAGEQRPLTQLPLGTVPVAPGDVTRIVLTTEQGRTEVDVPVLPPQGYYATLTPSATTAGTPTPATSTVTVTVTPTTTP